MPDNYDIIILGAGAMGCAAASHLARRGRSVLAIEQFGIAHDRGSSHGRSRVIRKAYFEDPRYVPMLLAAYELWRELERDTGRRLLHTVGCLNIGPPDHPRILGVERSVREHNLPHEILTTDDIARRWPVFQPAPGDIAFFEPEGGFVAAEEAIRAHVEVAERKGAIFRLSERVTSWNASTGSVHVETDAGRYEAAQLIITAGAWLAAVAAELNLPLKVERQVQFWFMPQNPDPFTAPNLPSFILSRHDRPSFYGIPMQEHEGVKIARHHHGEFTTADALNRGILPEDEAVVRDFIRNHVPLADAPLIDAKVCMYTNTPDNHFIIDRHPKHENVIIAGGFSGHGFKFAPLVGAILADLAIDRTTRQPIDFLSINRPCLK